MKDNFSRQSGAYAKFRPVYPPELYQFIFGQLTHFDRAWDCGTGNGQVAAALATRFGDVEATDISAQQLERAVRKPNIHYSCQAAETADFPADHFDLITVGQAIHWFDHDRFYPKVQEVLKTGGVLAEFGYRLFRSTPAINEVIDHFYQEIIGPYWDEERRHIDDGYARIPFPLEPIPAPVLFMEYRWTWDELLGYLSTWSSVQHYLRQRKTDPVALIRAELEKAWAGADHRGIRFEILLRIGRK
ncbi:class I SAM-dependent methyltransferase [Flavilitoribacter nigricans]|uniref:SAM-dependent methyltransferase n=1 Tax=Flavilitoribacter nigricans (strain ATCC 23147 / DSM 23189 / NBRC 102662 / NCIMB 1420 / SS-2) TaxID=1122177 RepID=A0A2D0N615_FLAN2|nr:class I SAM-dependent methyltransferase [Flavilitoribacter nigricans]PHN03213.1 SAM-dependent methyltransferase [Flavilitoribacter nigricans DSM 23189 = NBRC 102662]